MIRFNSYSTGWERGLSNFEIGEVYHGDRYWRTAEHAYQAAKTLSEVEKDRIFEAFSPAEAKKLGRSLTLRPDWDTVKVGIMTAICRDKLARWPVLRAKLLATGDEELIHVASWDSFWGDGKDGQGRNELGRIYMKLRKEIRELMS